MYQALYRKWRPKTFADVTGQDHITETLRKQVAEGRTSHAYLFTGTRGTGVVPEGIGKTNLAQTAFGSVFGASLGAKFVAVCLLFFAFSTILSWNLFGKINADYLFGKKNGKLCSVIYTIIALVFIFLGTVSGSDFVWEVTDMFNNFIVLPNVIALFALTGMVVASLNEMKKNKLKV